MKATHALFLAIIFLAASCGVGGIKYTAASLRPEASPSANGEMQCRLIPSTHLDPKGQQVGDLIEANYSIASPFDTGNTIRAIGFTYADMRNADTMALMGCGQTAAVINASRLSYGGNAAWEEGHQALAIVKDLVSTAASEEAAAQNGQAHEASPASQPTAQAQHGQAAQGASNAPAPTRESACSKIRGAEKFEDLAAGFDELASATKEQGKKAEYVRNANMMREFANVPGQSVTAHKNAAIGNCN